MSDFIGKSHELIQNLMGTDHLPVFLKCMPGKASSGYTFYHKIGANYLKVQCLYEAAYKFGRIQNENIDETYIIIYFHFYSEIKSRCSLT